MILGDQALGFLAIGQISSFSGSWEARPEQAETWTERTEQSETWTERTEQSESWTQRQHF